MDEKSRRTRTPEEAGTDASFAAVAGGVYPRAIRRVRRQSLALSAAALGMYMVVGLRLLNGWVSKTPPVDPATGKIPAAAFRSYLDDVAAASQHVTLVLMVPLLIVLVVVRWVSRAVRYRLQDRYDQARQDGLIYEPEPAALFGWDQIGEMSAVDRPGRLWRIFSAVPPWSEVRYAATQLRAGL